MAKLLANRVNTVNPGGGIDPVAQPNVSQYGWTNAQSTQVNQLIAYTGMARDFSEIAKKAATFAGESSFDAQEASYKCETSREETVASAAEVAKDIIEIRFMKSEIDNTAAMAVSMRAAIIEMYDEMKVWKDDLQAEITALTARVKALEDKNP